MFALLFSLICLLTAYIYYISRKNEEYWTKRNVPFHKRNKFFGPFWDLIFGDRAFFQLLGDVYKKYPDAPCVGLGSCTNPTMMVRDPVNVQYITQVDFESFYHRGVDSSSEDGLADSIPFMNGKRWKVMRKNMTPLFTASKLKTMYSVMDKSAQDFVRYLHNHPEKLKGDGFNTMSTFCSAAIAASVFGITTESIFDSPFLEMAQTALKPSFWSNVRLFLLFTAPSLYRLLKLKLFAEQEEFFTEAVKQIIKAQRENGGKNTYFAELCVNLQNRGELKDNETGFSIKPTDELLAAQAFFFFVAGVEPSATSLFCILFELGRNPETLERVHNEVDKLFDKNQNKITYDSLAEFDYLQMVIDEGLRMYPPIGIIIRQCVKDAVLPAGNIKIERGTKIFLEVFETQRDPKIFPEPEKFNPERFSRESKHEAESSVMAFGKGNRICIGERFAKLQMLTGLIYLLRNFTVKSHVQGDEIKYKKEQFQVRPLNVDIEFVPRKNKSN